MGDKNGALIVFKYGGTHERWTIRTYKGLVTSQEIINVKTQEHKYVLNYTQQQVNRPPTATFRVVIYIVTLFESLGWYFNAVTGH